MLLTAILAAMLSPTAAEAEAPVKLSEKWRLWAGTAAQLDEPLDDPSKRQASGPKMSLSGLVTVGVELTL